MKGKEIVLHRFDPKREGAIPYSGLIGVSGTLYGTNCRAGPSDGVTAFKATTGGQIAVCTPSFRIRRPAVPRMAL
jgi:hypothetical protein